MFTKFVLNAKMYISLLIFCYIFVPSAVSKVSKVPMMFTMYDYDYCKISH